MIGIALGTLCVLLGDGLVLSCSTASNRILQSGPLEKQPVLDTTTTSYCFCNWQSALAVTWNALCPAGIL